ncbi:protein mono-ADP-ribosyltransferase PARP14-like [Conger conger]|uniref:protein mono-ADP-ribosyltransferase PARP14-like n=1 Tax=Conger conger TaxID=82655 RepID=UPI002A5A5775|nr:protein mono-ADP-ribosyltransferase PARP14-like [Conger conger]
MEENTLILVGLPGDFASVKSKLELYFRNKRKSGGEISEIRNDPNDKRKALLIYVEDEAAKSVLEKGPHKVDFEALGVVELQVKPLQEDGVANVKRIKPVPLPRRPLEKEVGFGKTAPNIGEANVLAKKDHDPEGCLMSVQLYDERKAEERLDPRRFILSGFSEDCKCSHLSVFIKSCSKGAEHSWEILNDGERIAVTFKQDIDVQAFLKKCSSKRLQNLDISASRLEYTDTVLVEGNMENISDEVLRAYFSSRSKGGQVKCVNLDNKPKSVLIEFEDFHVANRVAEEKHNICGVSLCALLYYSSLQQALRGEKPITPPSLLLHRLAHTWERKTKQAAEALLEKYSTVMLMSTEEVWDRVKDKCISLNLKTSRVTFESTKNSVVVVGQQNEVKKLQGEIQLLLNKAKEELDVEKNTVVRKISVDTKEELDCHRKHIYSNAGESKVLEKHQDALKAKAKDFACKLYLTVEQASQTSSHLSCTFKIGYFLTLTIAQGELSKQSAEAVICPLSGNMSFDNPVGKEIVQFGGPQILLKRLPFAGDIVEGNPGKLSAKALIYAGIPTWHNTNKTEFSRFCDTRFLASAVKKSLQNAESKHCVSMVMPALGCGAFGFPIRISCEVIDKEIAEFCNSHCDTPPHLREIFIVDSDAKTVEEFHTVLKEKGYQSTDSTETQLSVPPANTTKQATPPPPRLPKPGSDCIVDSGGITIILKKGDITKEVVDAIVNSSNNSLNLDTGVSGAILKAAGKSVQDECAKLGTQNEDGVVVTGGGNLKCKHIIQMVGPTTTAGITTSTERVLQLCESKNTTAVSFPAIGTGRGNIQPEQSIKAILKGLQNHLSQTTSTTIKFIFIVAFEQKVFDSFCHYLEERNQQSLQRKEAVTGFHLPSIQSRSMQLPANQVEIHGIRIEVKKGDITKETVRGIVNTTNNELNLKAGVSGAIFRAAGRLVKKECKKFGPQQDDGVVVTSGGSLQCDFIIHMVGPRSSAAATSQVEKVLEQCEKNNITTVSFPAIGTGGGKLSAVDVIDAMLLGFHNHLSQHNSTVLKLMYIVVYEDKILQDFLQGLKQWSIPKLDTSGEEEDDMELSTTSELDTKDEDMDEDDNEGSIEIIMGPIKVKALCGDITQETTDVIVSSTNTSLDLSSGVSGAILKAAGQTVLDECRALGTQPKDGVVITKPGNLKSKHIIHMVGQTKERDITNSMCKVLETCDHIKAQTVAFPALGTGAGNLTASQVANAMTDAISYFILDKPKSSITAVNIVIFQPKIISDFGQVMKKFKRVTPMPGVAAEIAAQNPPNSSPSRKNSNQSLESMTADITFPVMVAEVYGASVANLAQVKKCLDDLISEECTSQDVVDNYLHLLAEKDKQDIVETSQRHQVHISMLQNRLTVSGKREDVLFVVMQIKDSLQRARERESQKREERRIWQTVRWMLGRSDTWKGLKKQINCELELAFHRKDKFYTYQNEKGRFMVDFEKMEQRDSGGQISRIKRTPLSDSETAIITTPATWTKMDGKDLDIILLLENSDEFQKISEGFVQSCQVFAQNNSKKIEVVQIQRIQHQEQWRKYAVSKQALDKKYQKSDNEQLLYHGTTKDICQKINKNGFNRSFCGRNATIYGSGTYFAKEAYYSCHDQYSTPDGNGHKYIYRARVLTGKPCLGLQGMKAPSPVDPNNLQTGLHDCAVDKLQNPFIFVIFYDSGAYPEYLITFKTV